MIIDRCQADLKVLEEKPDLENAIAELESASRGWFQEEADFQEMCAFEEKEAKSKYALKVKAKQNQQPKKGLYSEGTSMKNYFIRPLQ